MNLTPFRLRVLTTLASSLQTLTPDNGSRFDMRSSVFVGRDRFGDNDPVPMIAILEDLDTIPPVPSQSDNPARVTQWGLLVQGFVEHDTPPIVLNQAYHLAAEVEARLGYEKLRTIRQPGRGPQPDILGMGGRVDSLNFAPAIVRPADGEIADKAYFWLRLSLGIVENLVNPYE